MVNIVELVEATQDSGVLFGVVLSLLSLHGRLWSCYHKQFRLQMALGEDFFRELLGLASGLVPS